MDDDNEGDDQRGENSNRDVQRDIDSEDEEEAIVAPTWHLSDKTPSKRIEESSPRLSNSSPPSSLSFSPFFSTDRARTGSGIVVALLTTMLFTSSSCALTHVLPK